MININGRSYSGKNVSIVGDKVYIDGKVSELSKSGKVINITVSGNLDKLDCDNANHISIEGDCHNVKSQNGDVKIKGNVTGDVVNKNGNIKCGNVGGDVTTKNGNIKHIK